MKKNSRSIFLMVLLALFLAHDAGAESSVWKVVKGEKQLFIGGTVHLLKQSDYPLPSEFEEAYSQSKVLVLEADIQKMDTPEFTELLMSKVTYSDGRNLKMDLDESTFQDLEQHLAERGIPMHKIVTFKPAMVAITLSFIEMQRLGMIADGVDQFFYLKAVNDQKELGELETVYEQLELIVNLGAGQENDLIAHTLSEINEIPEMMELAKDAWRRGDNRKLEEALLMKMKSDDPEIYNEIVVERNNSWIPKIEALLNTEAVEFILVGALHLVGDDGVLSQLAARGYEIQQL